MKRAHSLRDGTQDESQKVWAHLLLEIAFASCRSVVRRGSARFVINRSELARAIGNLPCRGEGDEGQNGGTPQYEPAPLHQRKNTSLPMP